MNQDRTPEKLSPESQLLLCCGRVGEKNSARVGELLEFLLDWRRLQARARRHNLAPLLFWTLQPWSEKIPAAAWGELRADFEGNAKRNFFLLAQLLEILARFEAQGIGALAYKGPALALAAYGNILLRPFCDLDLLVPRAAVLPAGVLLAQLGFSRGEHAGAARGDYAQQWRRENGDVVVELHWDIALRHQAAPLNWRALWRAPAPLELGGAEVFAPAPDDLLLLLAWHGYKHRWSVLEWSAAFAGCVRRAENEGCDWPRLWAKARRSGSVRVLLLALALAHALFDSPLPGEAWALLERDAVARKLAQQIGEGLQQELENRERFEQARWYHLRSRERMCDKTRYLWRLVQAPREVDWRFKRRSFEA